MFAFQLEPYYDLSRVTFFDGLDGNAFGVAAPRSEALHFGTTVLEPEAGGSCRCHEHHVVPHCHGTHTETLSHVYGQAYWRTPAQLGLPFLLKAWLATVPVCRLGDVPTETTPPTARPDDWVWGAYNLRKTLSVRSDVSVLVLRHPPVVTPASVPPYFTYEAFSYLLDTWAVLHLIVEVPSIDRLDDAGLLGNHRAFWPAASDEYAHKTITELACIPPEVADGPGYVHLDLANWEADAVPSRPLWLPASMQA